MPAKIPFLEASDSLQQRWREATSPGRINAQIYVFTLLIAIGLLRRYFFPSFKSSADRTYGLHSATHEPGAKDETIGTIDSIYIYPIKSCSGVSVTQAQLTGQGFDLDRRWMVVRPDKGKMSLREEPRLTLVQPVIDEDRNELRLRLTAQGKEEAKKVGKQVGESVTILRPTEEQLKGWKEMARIEMYGDFADGRVAELPPSSAGGVAPSEWISEFLGYPVQLIHFDTTSATARNAFPIFKPPSDSSSWSELDKTELHRRRGTEFQDEYPLLVSSLPSLHLVRSQLSSALTPSDDARPITGLDPLKWSDPTALSMARFRPNIVVSGEFPPFSEDSWERIWIEPKADGAKAMLQLVARCQRCLLTAVDPLTAEKDASVPLKLLNRSRMRVKKVKGVEGGNGRAGPCFGMYAIPLPLQVEQPGEYGDLKTGDTIKVRWRPYALDDEPDRQKH